MNRLTRFVIVVIAAVVVAGCSTTSGHSSFEESGVDEKSAIYWVNLENDRIGVGEVIIDYLYGRGMDARPASVNTKAGAQQDKPAQASSGSGFVVAPDGLIVTNAHVVSGHEEAMISYMGNEYPVEILMTDSRNDVALLQPKGAIQIQNWYELRKFSRSDIAEEVTVIGYPLSGILSEEPRVTKGHVSSASGIEGDRTMFQLSAPIQPGNSGGPIITEDFKVVGVATGRLSDKFAMQETGSIPQNVNFGLKSNYVFPLIDEMEVTKHPGTISNIEEALDSVVLVRVGDQPEDKDEDYDKNKLMEAKNIYVSYRYTYTWDMIHWMLESLNITLTDVDSGEVVARGRYAGDTFNSYVGTTKNVLDEIFEK